MACSASHTFVNEPIPFGGGRLCSENRLLDIWRTGKIPIIDRENTDVSRKIEKR